MVLAVGAGIGGAVAGAAATKALGAAASVAGAATTVKDVSDAIADASFGVTGIRGTKPDDTKMSTTKWQDVYEGSNGILTNPKIMTLAGSKFGAVTEPEKSVTPNKKPILTQAAQQIGKGVDYVSSSFRAVANSGRPQRQNLQLALTDEAAKRARSGQYPSVLTSRSVRTVPIDPLTGNPVKTFDTRLPWAPGYTDTTPSIGSRVEAPRTAAGWLYGGEGSDAKTFGEFLAGLFSNQNAVQPANETPAVVKDQSRLPKTYGLPLLRDYGAGGIPANDLVQLPRPRPEPPANSPVKTVSISDMIAPSPMPGRPASIDRKTAPTPFPAYLADDAYLGRGGADVLDFEAPAPMTPQSMANSLWGSSTGTRSTALPSGQILPGDPDYDPTFSGAQVRISSAPATVSTTPPAASDALPWVTGSTGDTPISGSGNGTLPGPGLGMIDIMNVDWWRQAGAALLVLLVIAALLVYGVRKTLN